jgi:AcrR family transcriptional regulator
MRLVHALAEIVCEQGLAGASAARVAALAGVSQREFELCFGDLEHCLSWGCEQALIRAASSARGAAATVPDGLDGLMAFAEQQSELAGLCLARLCEVGVAGFAGRPGERPAGCERACRQLGPGLAAVGAALDVLGALPGVADAQLARAARLRDGAQAARLRALLVLLGLLSAGGGARRQLTPAGAELKWMFVHGAPRSRPASG